VLLANYYQFINKNIRKKHCPTEQVSVRKNKKIKKNKNKKTEKIPHTYSLHFKKHRKSTHYSINLKKTL